MKNLINIAGALALLTALAGCTTPDMDDTIHKNPAALHGDYSGKDFSGSGVFVPDAVDIPGVPESNVPKPRWSKLDRAQALFIDAHCQEQLFEALPDWAQGIVKEGGWGALAIAVAEGGFAAAFPGTDIVRYMLAGLGYGGVAYANNGRVRMDSGNKGSQGYCVALKLWRAQKSYPGKVLPGFDFIPWNGPGHTSLPPARNQDTDPVVAPSKGDDDRPPPLVQ